jgi:hypothetical protein
MIRPNIVSRSKIMVEQHFSLTEQQLKVLAKTRGVLLRLVAWAMHAGGDFMIMLVFMVAVYDTWVPARCTGDGDSGTTQPPNSTEQFG